VRRLAAALALCPAAVAAGAVAGAGALTVVPRTADEAARVEAVTAPTTDF
jgi:hypothetical protein